MFSNQISENIKIFILGSSAGKSSLLDRLMEDNCLMEDNYSETLQTISYPRKKRIQLDNGDFIFCDLYEDIRSTSSNELDTNPCLWKVDAFVITCDLRDNNSLAESEKLILIKQIKQIRSSRNDHPPIFLVGTKNGGREYCGIQRDQLPKIAIESKNCSYLRGTSAQDVFNIFKPVATHVANEITQKKASLIRIIKEDLDKYTSTSNYLKANLQFVFSLGKFNLGLTKLKIAKKMKADLQSANFHIEDFNIKYYQKKNIKAVGREFYRSCLFAENYAKIDKGKLTLNEGRLGRILKDHETLLNANKSLLNTNKVVRKKFNG